MALVCGVKKPLAVVISSYVYFVILYKPQEWARLITTRIIHGLTELI
jgi:hypothetical protein